RNRVRKESLAVAPDLHLSHRGIHASTKDYTADGNENCGFQCEALCDVGYSISDDHKYSYQGHIGVTVCQRLAANLHQADHWQQRSNKPKPADQQVWRSTAHLPHHY